MDEKTKATMLKYRKNSREQIQVDMAKGMKAKIKAYADKNGVSMSALILRLLETEMEHDSEFTNAWQAQVEAESVAAESAKQAEIDRLKADLPKAEPRKPVQALPERKMVLRLSELMAEGGEVTAEE